MSIYFLEEIQTIFSLLSAEFAHRVVKVKRKCKSITFLSNKGKNDKILKFRPPSLLLKGIGSVKRKPCLLSRAHGRNLFQAYLNLDVVGGLKLSTCYSDRASYAFSTLHGEQINSVKTPRCNAVTYCR